MCRVTAAPTIKTERLTLKPLILDDAPAAAEYCADFDVARMTTRMPHPYGIDDAVTFIAKMAERTDPDYATFSIRDPGNGLIGVIGFHRGETTPSPEVGYWLGRPWWGKGYATEALKGVLRWARDDRGRRAVYASHFIDNPASGGVLIKAGFLYTGDITPMHSAARGETVPARQMVWLA